MFWVASQKTIGVDMDTHRRTVKEEHCYKEWVFGKKMVKLVVRM